MNYFYIDPGEPVKMAMANVDKKLPPSPMLRQLSENLTALLPRLSVRFLCPLFFLIIALHFYQPTYGLPSSHTYLYIATLQSIQLDSYVARMWKEE